MTDPPVFWRDRFCGRVGGESSAGSPRFIGFTAVISNTVELLWRGGLSERRTAPFGCAAAAPLANVNFQIHRGYRF